MKTRALKKGFALSALALAMSPAMAAELRFDGFASFVAGQVLDKDELEPVTREVQTLSGPVYLPDGYAPFRGYDENIGFQNNSLFAVQVRADLQNKLSATAQIVAKGESDWDAKFNWAYLSYEINNNWTAKFGRSRVPYFMFSDFLDVGYAYHWISPPDSVYFLGGFDSIDGVMLENQVEFGGWVSRLTLGGGRSDTDIDLGDGTSSSISIRDLAIAAWSMNYDWLTLRAIYSVSQASIASADLDSLAVNILAPQGVSQSAIDGMLMEEDDAYFAGVGFNIDTGNFLLVGEYIEKGLKDNILSDPGKSWYVSTGYRFSGVTPYLTYEHVEADVNTDGRDDIIAEMPGGALNPTASYVVAAYQDAEQDSDTYGIGVRYDFHPSAAAKLEYTKHEDNITELEPEVVAIAIDLVF